MPHVKAHHVYFERNVITGIHRVRCTCGWFWWGTLEECQARVATHDLEWQPIDPVPESEHVG